MHISGKKRTEAIINAFAKQGLSSEDRRRLTLLVSLLIVGIIFLTTFGIIAIIEDFVITGIFDLITAFILVLNLWGLSRSKRLKTNIYIGIFVVSMLFLFLILTGGVNNTAHLWYFTYPLIACYSLGSIVGVRLSLLMLLPVVGIAIINPKSNFFSESPIFIFRFISSYLVISLFSYLFERGREVNKNKRDSIARSLEKLVDMRTSELVKDINKRKIIEKGLSESEQKYRTIVENISDLLCVHDLEGKIIDTNLHFKHNFGFEQSELIGHNIVEFIADEFKGDFKRYLDRMVANKKDEGLFVVNTSNGEKRILEYRNILIHRLTGKYEIHGFAEDITDRWKAEKQLENSEKRYRMLFEKAEDAILIIDVSKSHMGQIVDANISAARMYGYGLDEIKSLNVNELNPPGDEKKLFSRIESIIKGEWNKREIEHIRKDGTLFQVDASAGVLEIDKKQYILAIERDVSEKKLLEKRLRRAEKMEAIGVLAGGIAHDFNNILTPIIGHSQVLMMDLGKADPTRDTILKILTCADRAKCLVQQILTFSRQENDEFRPMKIQSIISEVTNMIRSTIPASIEIQVEIDRDCGAVLANPTQMHQLLMNVLTNAYHSINKNIGKIQLRLSNAPGEEFDHPGLEDNRQGHVCLEISDTGIGMDESTAHRIFEPFYTTKEKGKGTGMGLSVVHGIVKRMNGEVVVNSQVGKGTQFKFYFPLAQAEYKRIDMQDPQITENGTERILFIDDEKEVIFAGQDILERLGYVVDSYHEPSLAIKAFQKDPKQYDLVITDLSMPQIPGDHLAREILAQRQDIPIILMTGFCDESVRASAQKIGIKKILKKPFEMDKLSRNLRDVLTG